MKLCSREGLILPTVGLATMAFFSTFVSFNLMGTLVGLLALVTISSLSCTSKSQDATITNANTATANSTTVYMSMVASLACAVTAGMCWWNVLYIITNSDTCGELHDDIYSGAGTGTGTDTHISRDEANNSNNEANSEYNASSPIWSVTQNGQSWDANDNQDTTEATTAVHFVPCHYWLWIFTTSLIAAILWMITAILFLWLQYLHPTPVDQQHQHHHHAFNFGVDGESVTSTEETLDNTDDHEDDDNYCIVVIGSTNKNKASASA